MIKLKEFIDNGLCKICFEKQADYAMVPCGHLSYCFECVTALSHCAICRCEKNYAIQIFK